MQHVEAKKLSKHTVTKVWNVREFCQQNQLGEKEEIRLLRLFGRFATAKNCCTMQNGRQGGGTEVG